MGEGEKKHLPLCRPSNKHTVLRKKKQFGVEINKEIEIIVCVLTHSCAGAWLTRELCEAEQKMNHPLEGGLLTILAGGAECGY